MKNRKLKISLAVIAALIGAVVLTAAGALAVLQRRTDAILDDYSAIYGKEEYETPVSVEGVDVIKQDVSCGYAVIEMFSSWCGRDVTEESLYREYGRVVTSTGKSFAVEMNKRFPEYSTEINRYLTNTELIDAVYQQLSLGVPVPVEWAAENGGEWTLHYSLVTGMDIPNDRITVANPYGYVEQITVGEFLQRTSFEAYEKMPLFLKLGFAFGIFEKNTVFTVRAK